MRSFKRLKSEYYLQENKDLNNHQFFGLLLASYQELRAIKEDAKVKALIEGVKK